nr:hypothetical protein [Tanacetum cinerariifolium]
VQDYALWDDIKNGNSFKRVAQTITNDAGTSTTLIPGLVTTEEKAQKKNDEDLNLKFLRSFSSEWNTHVVVWRNKFNLDTMRIDDLYNNFKIIEQEVKGTAFSDLSSQNMAFLTSPSTNITNEVSTAYGVSTTSTQSSTASTKVSTANLSDVTVYAFLSNQSNRSQLVHEDLEQIHKDDLEEMDLKWQLALLSMRAKSKSWNQDSSRRTINVEETPPKAMVAIDGVGFDWSYMAEDEVLTNMAVIAFSYSETVCRFLTSPSTNITNEVSTAYGVSTTSTQSSTASTKVSTANLSNVTVYAFLSNQSNGSQLVHEDLEQIHEDDLEEMDLKWQLALLSMRAKSKSWNQDSSRRTINVEETPPKAMVAIDGVGFDWSYMAEDEVLTNMALIAFSYSE